MVEKLQFDMFAEVQQQAEKKSEIQKKIIKVVQRYSKYYKFVDSSQRQVIDSIKKQAEKHIVFTNIETFIIDYVHFLSYNPPFLYVSIYSPQLKIPRSDPRLQDTVQRLQKFSLSYSLHYQEAKGNTLELVFVGKICLDDSISPDDIWSFVTEVGKEYRVIIEEYIEPFIRGLDPFEEKLENNRLNKFPDETIKEVVKKGITEMGFKNIRERKEGDKLLCLYAISDEDESEDQRFNTFPIIVTVKDMLVTFSLVVSFDQKAATFKEPHLPQLSEVMNYGNATIKHGAFKWNTDKKQISFQELVACWGIKLSEIQNLPQFITGNLMHFYKIYAPIFLKIYDGEKIDTNKILQHSIYNEIHSIKPFKLTSDSSDLNQIQVLQSLLNNRNSIIEPLKPVPDGKNVKINDGFEFDRVVIRCFNRQDFRRKVRFIMKIETNQAFKHFFWKSVDIKLSEMTIKFKYIKGKPLREAIANNNDLDFHDLLKKFYESCFENGLIWTEFPFESLVIADQSLKVLPDFLDIFRENTSQERDMFSLECEESILNFVLDSINNGVMDEELIGKIDDLVRDDQPMVSELKFFGEYYLVEPIQPINIPKFSQIQRVNSPYTVNACGIYRDLNSNLFAVYEKPLNGTIKVENINFSDRIRFDLLENITSAFNVLSNKELFEYYLSEETVYTHRYRDGQTEAKVWVKVNRPEEYNRCVFAPPEYERGKYDKKSEMYSLGMLMFRMLYHEHFERFSREYYESRGERRRPHISQETMGNRSKFLHHLESLFHTEAGKRPSFKSIKKHIREEASRFR